VALLVFVIDVGGDTGDKVSCAGDTPRNPRVAAANRLDPVRLVVELDDTVTQRYYAFCVKVDQFTLLTLEDCTYSSLCICI
jgi:hypothetical protein